VGCAEYVVGRTYATSGAVPIGFPITNMQMYVLDQHLEPVPLEWRVNYTSGVWGWPAAI